MRERILHEGFILTKWYVNLRGLPNEVKDRFGFILTKWYVNEVTDIPSETRTKTFYIN